MTEPEPAVAVVWFYRPHLPSPDWPAGAPGLLIVTEAGHDRFFDVSWEGPAWQSPEAATVDGWRVCERGRGAAVLVCYRPGAVGGWPYAAALRAALRQAGLPLFTTGPSRWRSTGDFAANDPAGYANLTDALADAEEPGK